MALLRGGVEGLSFEDLIRLAVAAHQREVEAATKGVVGVPPPVLPEQLEAVEAWRPDARGTPATAAEVRAQCAAPGEEASDDDEPLRCCSSAHMQSLEDHVLGINSNASPASVSLNRWMKRLDILMSVLVVISAVNLFAEVEVRSRSLAERLESGSGEDAWDRTSMTFFYGFEHVANVVFLAEIAYRICRLRRAFFWDEKLRKFDSLNILDLAVVFVCSIDLYVLPSVASAAGGTGSGNLSSMRLVRVLRLARALRIVRVMTSFSKLRILLVTTASSFLSLFWSMVLIFLLVYAAAVALCQVLQGAVEDDQLSIDMRRWIFTWYGSGARSVWTLFLITFSGGWPNYVQPLITDLHWGYAVFFAAYVWVVVFAVTRIITALFLKDTLQAASDDLEMMMREQKLTKARVTQKLKALFVVADANKDGAISMEEFRAVVRHPKALTYFSALDLCVPEACELFEMLDDGDGSISYDEFCTGVLRLKGQARTLDVVSMMRDNRRIMRTCAAMAEEVKHIRLNMGGMVVL